MAKTKVIILAAGDGSRWGNYRDTTKHLVTVEREVLLHRTCKQFLKYTNDVAVIGLDERYKVDGTSLYIIKSPNTNWKDGAKIMSSKPLWSTNGRTVLVFGDVYFTHDAVKAIMTDDKELCFFLRKGPNETTGARWKEIFAIAFKSHMNNQVSQTTLLQISRGQMNVQAGWSLYKAMIGPVFGGDMFANNRYVEIDDWTEDFDFPEDLEIWEAHRKAAKTENAAKTRATKAAGKKSK